MRWWAALALPALGIVVAGGSLGSETMRGVPNPERASQNWMLKCQGCHRPDGSGTAATAPAVADTVSTLLRTPAGRRYLVRVPGVATAALPDDQLAELVNWMLQRFDRAHLPPDFEPYTPGEVGLLRQQPLRTEASDLRRDIMAHIQGRDFGAGRKQGGE